MAACSACHSVNHKRKRCLFSRDYAPNIIISTSAGCNSALRSLFERSTWLNSPLSSILQLCPFQPNDDLLLLQLRSQMTMESQTPSPDMQDQLSLNFNHTQLYEAVQLISTHPHIIRATNYISPCIQVCANEDSLSRYIASLLHATRAAHPDVALRINTVIKPKSIATTLWTSLNSQSLDAELLYPFAEWSDIASAPETLFITRLQDVYVIIFNASFFLSWWICP